MLDRAGAPVSSVGSSLEVGVAEIARDVSSTAAAEGADFGSVLGTLALNAMSAVKSAETISVAGVRGQASVQQVVEAVMSAEQTLQSAIAIRDKVVSAYIEISRMQI